RRVQADDDSLDRPALLVGDGELHRRLRLRRLDLAPGRALLRALRRFRVAKLHLARVAAGQGQRSHRNHHEVVNGTPSVGQRPCKDAITAPQLSSSPSASFFSFLAVGGARSSFLVGEQPEPNPSALTLIMTRPRSLDVTASPSTL